MIPPAPAVALVPTLGADAPAWDDLVLAQPLVSPFARTWWLAAMAYHTTDEAEPCYLLVHQADRLVGGVALVEDRLLGVPRFRFLGQGVLAPDHLDLLALPGHEDAVVAAFRDWFGRDGSRLLHLDGVDETALVRRAVPGRSRPGEAAPYAPLPETGDAFAAGLSGSFRRSTRRAARRLAAAGHAYGRVPDADVDAALAAFWQLHERRGDRARLISHRHVLDAAVRAGVARGECRVDVLGSATAPIAVTISFEVAGRLSFYQLARSMRDEHGGAGTVLLVALFEDAAESGCREVDLLRGEESYKQHFSTLQRPLAQLEASHGVRARMLAAARHRARAAREARLRRADSV
ncbi:MAG: GNAT family N-acetyltransferase [Marmoricola sp.]